MSATTFTKRPSRGEQNWKSILKDDIDQTEDWTAHSNKVFYTVWTVTTFKVKIYHKFNALSIKSKLLVQDDRAANYTASLQFKPLGKCFF